jgi:putative MATE family efflux protein
LRPVVDMMVVGRLGAAPIAGIGIGTLAVMVAESLTMGLTVGLRAMIARLVGAGDKEAANHAAQQGYVVSIILATVLAATGASLAEEILLLLGVEPEVATQGAPYIRIAFVAAVFMTVRNTNDAIFEASGDTVTPMKIIAVYTALHAVLCPFLVYGWWLFPRLGISGAALPGVVAQSIAASIGLWILLSGQSRLQLTFRNFNFDFDMVWRIVKIGAPASITSMERSFAQLIVMWFVVPFGTIAVAAHSIHARIDMIIYLPIMAWAMGAGILVGQNVGAGQPDRAQKTAWLGVAISSALMLLISTVIWFWAEGIVRIFTPQTKVIDIAATFLRIEIVALVTAGLIIVLSQCLNGVGDTLPVMLVNLVTVWGVQVPLAHFLTQVGDLGVYGVRWALVTGMLCRAVFYLVYFQLGRWKHKNI